MGLITESIHKPEVACCPRVCGGMTEILQPNNPMAPSHQKPINPERVARIYLMLHVYVCAHNALEWCPCLHLFALR